MREKETLQQRRSQVKALRKQLDARASELEDLGVDTAVREVSIESTESVFTQGLSLIHISSPRDATLSRMPSSA